MENSKFYKASKVIASTSNGVGRYAKQVPITYENVLVEEKGKTAYIHVLIGPLYDIVTKRINSKFYELYGREITERTFTKHINLLKKEALVRLEEIKKRKELEEQENELLKEEQRRLIKKVITHDELYFIDRESEAIKAKRENNKETWHMAVNAMFNKVKNSPFLTSKLLYSFKEVRGIVREHILSTYPGVSNVEDILG